MRLLFDENLSPRLVNIGVEAWPDSAHVETLAGRGASDAEIWALAARGGLTIVTKDDDFRGLALLHGPPPKVICLQVGNASTSRLAAILKNNLRAIELFHANSFESILVVASE